MTEPFVLTVTIPAVPLCCVWTGAVVLYLLIGLVLARWIYRQVSQLGDEHADDATTFAGFTLLAWPLTLVAQLLASMVGAAGLIGRVVSIGLKKGKD